MFFLLQRGHRFDWTGCDGPESDSEHEWPWFYSKTWITLYIEQTIFYKMNWSLWTLKHDLEIEIFNSMIFWFSFSLGHNCSLNFKSWFLQVVAFNRTVEKVEQFLQNEAKGTKVVGAKSLEDMVSKLKKPRRVMLLVKAGQAVDDFILKLVRGLIILTTHIQIKLGWISDYFCRLAQNF